MSKLDDLKSDTYLLGKKGYIINKKNIENSEIEQFRNELSVTPFNNMDFGVEEKPFRVYRENSTHLYLPKFYGLNNIDKNIKNILPDGKDIDVNFNLELKEEQKEPARKTMDAYQEKGGGILSLPCGSGKTIIGLYFVSKLKKKTMVIVHKEFLMNQWIERIKFALPEAKIGIVQGDKCEIEGVDIVLAMLQTLSMRKFPKDTFDDIGHVIIDECHRIPSRTFSKALFKINCKYMLGLSATPNRKDGLTKVLKWFIGELIYSVKMNEKNIVKVNRYLIKSEDKIYNKEVLSFRGQVQMATMINNIVNYIKRSKFIVNLIEKELEDEKRQILILSDRRQQLEDFERLLKEKDITSVGYYVGGVKRKKLKENESCRVLLGTFPMANEGLDIPTLNGLILATPKSDIIQSVGRISRVIHKDIQPLIIDVVDQFSMFERQGTKRFEVYRKKKYEIEDFEYNMDSDNILGQKRYFFHNVLKDEEYESSDDECEKKQIKLDEESEDEDKFLNMNTDNYKVKKKEKKSKKENMNDLLNSMSLFS